MIPISAYLVFFPNLVCPLHKDLAGLETIHKLYRQNFWIFGSTLPIVWVENIKSINVGLSMTSSA